MDSPVATHAKFTLIYKHCWLFVKLSQLEVFRYCYANGTFMLDGVQYCLLLFFNGYRSLFLTRRQLSVI